LYRLTPEGLATATTALADVTPVVQALAGAGLSPRRRLSTQA